MPRLVVVSIPGYNNSWWWGFGIPRDRTFESLPITSGVLLALGETGSMLRTVMMSVFGSRVPTISYLQPGPLFRQGLRIQLVDLVRSLQYESSAALFHTIARTVRVRFHFGFHRDHFLVRLTERMNVERALRVRNFTSEFLLIPAASRRIARHHPSQGRGTQDRSGYACSHLSSLLRTFASWICLEIRAIPRTSCSFLHGPGCRSPCKPRHTRQARSAQPR